MDKSSTSVFAVICTVLFVLSTVWLRSPVVSAQDTGHSLRFYGHGQNDIDRVKVRLDDPEKPIDVGGDFTIEFWMKALLSENESTAGQSCGGIGWIYGNIIIDRDVFGNGDYGDYGISLYNGRIRFGVGDSTSDQTICGATNVADGQWRHIAVTRRSSGGQVRLFVNGVQDAEGSGPSGDVSYRNGRSTPFPNDPFLVIGAEKHDAGAEYPSYSGYVDELRVSDIVRYAGNFQAPTVPFDVDADTVALFHFDDGPGNCTGTVADSASGSSDGDCRFGGSEPAGPVYTAETPFGGPTLDRQLYLPMYVRM